MELKNLKIIGNQEWCAFEELQIPAIHARIDSGAKTSSIQATDIKRIKKNNEDWVNFTVHPMQRDSTVKIKCSAKLADKRAIKSSVGISEERLIIKTPVTIGDDTFEVELSLAKRNTMKFRMLFGRDAIANRYLIDASLKNVQKKYLRREVNALYNIE